MSNILRIGMAMVAFMAIFEASLPAQEAPEGAITLRIVTDQPEAALGILKTLDLNRSYRNLAPYGEPQLGSRGIYRAMGGDNDPAQMQLAMLWVLNLSDGNHDLLAIAERAGIELETVGAAADLLVRHDLLEDIQKGMH